MLDRLKDDLATRHIPVHLITTEEDRERGLRMGAMGVLTKPLRTREALDEAFARLKRFDEPRERRVLLIESADAAAAQLAELVGGDGVQVIAVGTAAEAVAAVSGTRPRPFDLVDHRLGIARQQGVRPDRRVGRAAVVEGSRR